jgi:predicted RNA binding protein YcfA (HicA-like mRNA interferase family)
MTKLPRVPGRDVITALGRAGFIVARITGSHHLLRHPDGRGTTVPVHGVEVIGPGLLNKILRDAKMTREEFQALL